MKKRLLHLIRHAKSDWSTVGQSDFERPLNARGRIDAPMMAERFFTRFPSKKAFHVSAATRTRETADLFSKGYLDKISSTHFHQGLYHASAEDLLEFVSLLPENEMEVVIFTHNNGVSEFVSHLAQQNIEMPTCAIVTFELDEWAGVSSKDAVLIRFDYPKLDT